MNKSIWGLRCKRTSGLLDSMSCSAEAHATNDALVREASHLESRISCLKERRIPNSRHSKEALDEIMDTIEALAGGMRILDANIRRWRLRVRREDNDICSSAVRFTAETKLSSNWLEPRKKIPARKPEGSSIRESEESRRSNNVTGYQADTPESEIANEEVPDEELVLQQRDRSRIMNVTKASDVNVDQSDLDETVFIREGASLDAESLEGELAMIPEPSEDEGVATREDLMVGDPEVNTPEEIERMKDIIWKYPPPLHGQRKCPATSCQGRGVRH